MSVYTMTQDAGGYVVDDVRSIYIAGIAAASAAALQPARSLLDDSPARAVAVNLADAFASVGPLFESTLTFRDQLQADSSTRAEVLRARWQQFGDDAIAQGERTTRTIATGIDELEVALKAEALPASDDPAAVLVARQEIELALRANTKGELPFQVLLEQASRGGDIAAAAASEWGRLLVGSGQDGEDTGFSQVVDAAIETAATGPDERRRRAAAALTAMRTPLPGGRVAAIRQAQAYSTFVLDVVAQTVRLGIIVP